MQAIIYHNPKCSKSRQAYKILQEAGLTIKAINYLDNPPTVEELTKICQVMKVQPKDIIRTKEELFKKLNLSINDNRTTLEWLEIISTNPQLLERPIVKIGSKIALGRPPENITKILP